MQIAVSGYGHPWDTFYHLTGLETIRASGKGQENTSDAFSPVATDSYAERYQSAACQAYHLPVWQRIRPNSNVEGFRAQLYLLCFKKMNRK